MSNLKEKLGWSQTICDRIEQAVHAECKRAKVAEKFLPLHGPVPPGILPSDAVIVEDKKPLSIDENAKTDFVEIISQFTLTQQQVEREGELMTAVTLATRAANLLSQAEDALIFLGHDEAKKLPLFQKNMVTVLSGNAGEGLLGQDRSIPVEAISSNKWGEKTFAAVSKAYAMLQSGKDATQAHYGDYALVLRTEPYADTYAPLDNTLIMPADRIKPLMQAGFYGAGTLAKGRGVLLSLGGNTMDLVISKPPVVEFVTQDTETTWYRFRVSERFAFRLKDKSAVIRLEFDSGIPEVQGKKFVISDKLKTISQDKAKKIVEDAGGIVQVNFSKNVNYFVFGEDPIKKLNEAKKYDIRCVDEKEFWSLQEIQKAAGNLVP